MSRTVFKTAWAPLARGRMVRLHPSSAKLGAGFAHAAAEAGAGGSSVEGPFLGCFIGCPEASPSLGESDMDKKKTRERRQLPEGRFGVDG